MYDSRRAYLKTQGAHLQVHHHAVGLLLKISDGIGRGPLGQRVRGENGDDNKAESDSWNESIGHLEVSRSDLS